MSLYNNIAESLTTGRGGISGTIRSGVDTALGGMANAAAQALGGTSLAKNIVSMGQSRIANAAMSAINQHAPALQQVQRAVDVGAEIIQGIQALQDGNLSLSHLNTLWSAGGTVNGPGYDGWWGAATPLLGGITAAEAKNIYEQHRGIPKAKKNLWLLEVSSQLGGNVSDRFNMFATELDYSPFNLVGDKHKTGGAVIDAPQGTESVDLRMTTIDDQDGFIKRWFAKHHGAVVARDGTVGIPSKYAIRFTVLHAFITRDSNQGGYEDIGLYRPVSLEVSLSRREDGLQEVQMAFTQIDTFMRP